VLCAHDDELVPQKETKELKKVIGTPQRNRAQNRRFEAEKGERESERERDAKIRLIRHGLQCCKTSCLSVSTSFNAPGHWNFFCMPQQDRMLLTKKEEKDVMSRVLWCRRQQYSMLLTSKKTKCTKRLQVRGCLVSTNSSMQKERKKKGSKSAWIRVTTKTTTTALREEDHVLDPRIL
jgi:hypothetical protein